MDTITITRYLKSPLWHGVGASIVGLVRRANEDSCGYKSTPNGELFVVCDGMGGHVGGATASRIAVESIISYLSQQVWSNKPKAIEDALRFANTQILGTAANDPSLKGMGTTACIVLCEGQNVWIGHVGDSRIYLYIHKEKHLHRITKDHSYVQALVDRGEIDDRQAENHPQKNIIMRALGSKEDVIPEVEQMPIQVTRRDTFLICSDGLSGMIDDNEIEAILASDLSLDDKTEKLIKDANAPGKGKDNITVQLVQAMNDNPNAGIFPDFNPLWRQRTPNHGNGKMIATIVSASCVFLTMLIAGGVLLHNNHRQVVTNNVPAGDSTHLVVSDTEAEEYKAIDLEEDIISTDPTTTQAKTTEQIEQEADNLLKDIKKYEETINAKKETIKGNATQVENSIKDLDKKDLTASQEILTLANKTKGQADKDMNELKLTVNNAKQKQQALSKTNVTEKIKEADATIKEYEKAQKNAQDHITQITQDIRTIQTHINKLKEDRIEEKESGNAQIESSNDSIQNQEQKEDTVENISEEGNQKNGSGNSQEKSEDKPVRNGPVVGGEIQLPHFFNNDLPDDYYYYEWTSSDESIAIITRNIVESTKAVKGLKEGIVTITGKPKNKKNTNTYSVTLRIRPQNNK